MLIGLADESDPWESQEASAWTPAAVAASGALDLPLTTTIPEWLRRPDEPPTTTVKPKLPRTGGAVAKVLDVIVPKRLDAAGVVKIWGLPPAVAYTLLAVILTGAGLYAYKAARGGRRVGNPRGRGKKSRRKS